MKKAIVAFLVIAVAGGSAWWFGTRGEKDPSPSPETKKETNDESFTELAPDKQKKIWELEHFTFELEAKFGKKFKAAFKERQTDRLVGFFLDDFSGQIPTSARANISSGKWWQQKKVDGATADQQPVDARPVGGEGPTTQPADAKAVAEHLVSYIDNFAEVEAVKLRVLAIEPQEEKTNRWDIHIMLGGRGKSKADGPTSFESTHRIECEFAEDKDIEAGEIIAAWQVESATIRSANQHFLQEVTSDYGLDKLGLRDNWKPEWEPIRHYSLQVAAADFNLDGFLDLAVSSLDGTQMLLRSEGGKSFTEVTERVSLPKSRLRKNISIATWFDFDNDGYPDLLLGESLFRNVKGKQFVDVTDRSGVRFTEEPVGASIADFDSDGLLDLYVLNHRGNMASGEKIGYVNDDRSGAKNQLWRNLGDGQFEDVTAKTGVDCGLRHSFAAAWLFVNDDHFPDLYVANDFGRNQFFINRGMKDGEHLGFDDVTDKANVGDFATSMGVAAGDLNGDGRSELYVANMFSKMGRRIIGHVGEEDYPPGIFAQIQGSCAGNRLYTVKAENGENASLDYKEISESLGVNQVGWAYAPAMFDVDSDGFLDLYATTGYLSFERKKPDG